MGAQDGSSPQRIFGLPAPAVFWILLVILVLPSAFFLGNSFFKLDDVLESIRAIPHSATKDILSERSKPFDREAFRARAVIALERDVMTVRHQRSSAALATRTWLRFMSLIFGAILVLIGAAFILGKITVAPTKGGVGFGDLKMSLASSSPGLFLVLFGCGLIAIPNLSQQAIKTDDTASFIAKSLFVRFALPPPVGDRTSNTGKPSDSPEAKKYLDELRKKRQEKGAN